MSPKSHDRSDAERWNERYAATSTPTEISAPELVTDPPQDANSLLASGHGTVTPPTTRLRALDVACGWGDAGLFLALSGAEVTCTDVSAIALDAVERRALALDVEVTTIVADLTSDPIPIGPWDVITCAHYLDRALLPRLGAMLAPGGELVVAIATTTNLERHPRPSARFLLEPDELPSLVPDLDIRHHSEAWRRNAVHEAWLIASPFPVVMS